MAAVSGYLLQNLKVEKGLRNSYQPDIGWRITDCGQGLPIQLAGMGFFNKYVGHLVLPSDDDCW